MSIPTHYEILGLTGPTSSTQSLTAQTIKSAYRASLLKHHPDKSLTDDSLAPDTTSNKPFQKTVYSIDQIAHAYSTLSSPRLRAQYDRELILNGHNTSGNAARSDSNEVFRTGVEVVDLDELTYDEVEGLWYRSCRCGDERGFVVQERDLEDASDEGEVSVGCKGCSLWMKVQFGVVVDEGSQDVG